MLSESSRLSSASTLSSLIECSSDRNPFPPSASSVAHTFRFCVPDEWYRRSKSRSVSTTSTEPSEDTIRRLADMEEEEESGESGGTAKQKADTGSEPDLRTPTSGFSAPTDWRSSISQNRFSSMFESWIRPTSPTAETTAIPVERKVVSDPRLMDRTSRDLGSTGVPTEGDAGANDVDPGEFEEMLVCTCFKSGIMETDARLGRARAQGFQPRRYVSPATRAEAIPPPKQQGSSRINVI